MKQRIAYIDFLKGFAILLVLLGHCIQTYTSDYWHDIIFRYIYSFHMPLFMALSGYVSYKAVLKKTILKRRAKQLLIPFFTWPILNHCILQEPLGLSAYLDIIREPENGLWFLWALFFISVFFYFFDKISNLYHIQQEIIVVIGATCLLILGELIKKTLPFDFGISIIAWHFIFYAFGFYMKKYITIFSSLHEKVYYFIILCFIIGGYFWQRFDVPSFIHIASGVHLLNMAYRIFIAILGILTCFYLAETAIGKSVKCKALSLFDKHVGGGTLGIYCVQWTAIGISSKVIENNSRVENIITVFIIASITSILFENICSRWKYTRWLVGK